jgi:hypothetical protein
LSERLLKVTGVCQLRMSRKTLTEEEGCFFLNAALFLWRLKILKIVRTRSCACNPIAFSRHLARFDLSASTPGAFSGNIGFRSFLRP